MLGTSHILMIRHGFYRSLPHREGGGGGGNVTDRKQELRRQLRFVRRNLELIANLVRLPANLPIDHAAHAHLLRQRAKLRARLLTHRQNAVIGSEGPAVVPITRKCRSERQRSEPPDRAKGASARAASTAVHC